MNERAASSQHSGGFSVDAGVRIKATDRAGLERLLRYCARPPFAMDRLKQRGADLVYRCGKGHAEPLPSSKYSGELVLTPGTAPVPGCEPKPRPSALYLWAALIARIYEVFPLLCPNCGGQMRIIAFITFSADIQKILGHIGVEPEAPRITPARGPPPWHDCGVQETQELGVEAEPDWELASQSPPDYPDDQRTAW